MKSSKRISEIPMSGIRKMFDLAGPDSVNLGLGEPDLDPPAEAIEAMCAASKAGRNKYGPTAGIPELRSAVADYFSPYGRLDGSNIMVTPSGSTALLEVTQSMVDPGDEVLVPSPGFVIYAPHASLAGGTPVEYGLTDDGLFQPDIEMIKERITPRTSMIVVNTPSNPTGGVLTKESKKALLDIARDNDITILADEVYCEFVYEGEHQSFMDSLDC
ncbi:MAG: aminotransferase class I/II-fold pyridoxal phosphate-dependent enzyme, partial [Thermoplasmata archaeon]|nr:aminotransferase class I/II-fold pyridoxal phosphate-dependent enzyme [Thermoplasmata archaeon]